MFWWLALAVGPTATAGGRGEPVPFSPVIVLCLLAVLAASCVMYWLLVRRWTSHRQWVGLSEWARDAGFRFVPLAGAGPPAPFDGLRESDRPRVRLHLAKGETALLQLESDRPAPVRAPTPIDPPAVPGQPAAPPLGAPPVAASAAEARPLWNVLIRKIPSAWPPTALRPTTPDGAAPNPAGALEVFGLPSYPLMGTDRFIACGLDSAAARRLFRSHLRALLPPDIGLLLHGDTLVLDFSARHFDVLEFTRILVLAEQAVAHLPGEDEGVKG